MIQNIIKYVKSKYVKNTINFVLPVMIFAGIASMSGYYTGYQEGYHIGQKQEQEKHTSDSVGIRVEKFGEYARFSVKGTFANQSFSILNLQRFDPDYDWIKFESENNQLSDVIKNDIVKTDGSGCYDNLDVDASRYVHPTDDFLMTQIEIMPK